jgi:hypothetical protein
MAEDVKSKMNNDPKLVPSPWSRNTVADGSWMQNYTLKPLSSRDDFLADEISGVQYSIDLLKAANDVICVYGTYDEFTANSGNLTQLSDNDFIKVLRDNHYQPDESDPDYNTNDDDKYQVYYEYHISAHDGWDGWSAIGALDPYYSCDEIDDIVDDISATVSNNYLSANKNAVIPGKNIVIEEDGTAPKITIGTKDNVEFANVSATEKVSAKSGLITDLSAERIHIDGVSNDDWYNVALYSADAKKFYRDSDYKIRYNPNKDTLSSINYTCTNITGTTAKFTGFSGTNISASDDSTTATIKNLIDSAKSGRKAFDVVNSAKFSANNTSVGYLSAGLILSSKSPNHLVVTNESNNTIGLSSNGMTDLNIIAENTSKTLSSDYNRLKFIGFDLTANPGGVELGLDTSRFVMCDDVNLYIGSTGTLKSESNATALGFYTTATNASFAVGTMNNSTYKTSATIGSIALGHNNSANNYSITIGSDNSANNYSYIIGNNNKITGTGPGYILGVGNTADNGLCVLGAYAKASHDMGDLLALGFGDPNRKRDALLVNQGYVKLFGSLLYDEDEGAWVEPNIMITPNAISSTFSKKVYHFSEIQGYNLEDTDNPLKSFNDVASNNMLIMGKSPKDNSYDSRYFAVYLNPEENGLKNLSHSFKNISIAQNQVNQGYYGIRYGIANEYAVILKGFSPSNCQRTGATDPDPADWTNCEYKYGNTKSATWFGNDGTKLQNSFFYKEKNYIPDGYSTAPDMFYLKIDRIALDQVVETIIDSKQKLFIMIKGDGN